MSNFSATDYECPKEIMKKIDKILLIVEEDNDLSSSLSLFFSDTFSVKVLTDTDTISTYIDSAYCLLIDVDFVNKTGADLLRSIKSSYPAVKIVVMYKASQKKYPENVSYQRYSDASVCKPFDAQEIFNIISRIEHSETHK